MIIPNRAGIIRFKNHNPKEAVRIPSLFSVSVLNSEIAIPPLTPNSVTANVGTMVWKSVK